MPRAKVTSDLALLKHIQSLVGGTATLIRLPTPFELRARKSVDLRGMTGKTVAIGVHRLMPDKTFIRLLLSLLNVAPGVKAAAQNQQQKLERLRLVLDA